VVRAGESPQLGRRNQNSRSDPANEELLVRDQIIEGAATDREHSGRFCAPYEELLIWRKSSAARRLALGDVGSIAFDDVYFFHEWPPFGAYGIDSPAMPHCLHPAWDFP
jgi:hypothetical protein